MDTRDRLRKLSRYELVELIYELRKDNLELEKRLKDAEQKLAQRQAAGMDGLEPRLAAIEKALERISGSGNA